MKCRYRLCKEDSRNVCSVCAGNFCKRHSVRCSACKKYFCSKNWPQHKREETSKFSVRF